MLAAYALWVAELMIEALGAWLSCRRRNWILFAYFGFLAITDIALLLLLGQSPYAWTYWVQRAGKLTLLLILACKIAARMVREHNTDEAVMFTVILTFAAGLIVASQFSDGKNLAEKLQDAVMAANLILLVLLTVGWISRRGLLTPEWRIITAGFLVLIGSDLLFTFLWTFWEPARHLYPVGVIPAYGMWNWAMWKGAPQEVRAWQAEQDHKINFDGEFLKEMGISA